MRDIKFLVGSKENIRFYMKEIIKIERSCSLKNVWKKNNFLIDLDFKWKLSKIMFYRNMLIGFSIVSKKNDYTCHIHRFMVDQMFRSQGFGTFLLNDIKQGAKKFDYLTLYVDSKNDRAVSFYKKSFFKPILMFGDDIFMIFKC
ncbi:MAG: GNAT family N-acetyltransferase [Coxiellaceae bacterium]|jgi:ribosomal protein S18 acetylase RimI-like enzyme|nr:GNAT family N-acetyltransferase [Coxiellaceae bacterium]